MTDKIFFKNFFIACATLLISSCSLLSPVKVDPENTYELKSIPGVPIKKTHRITLLVSQPEANPVYNTSQMAYTLRPYEIAYFAKNRWASTPPHMLQNLITQTLQNTHYFHAVVSAPFIGDYDYVLNTQILELTQHFTCHSSFVRLTLRAELVQTSSTKVIATKQFSVIEPAPFRSPYGGVIAANHATSVVLAELARFSIHAIGKRTYGHAPRKIKVKTTTTIIQRAPVLTTP